ncbi:MAG: hypothetical protein RLY86_1004 [Pseudomonadota bacterium]|jgi:predicted dienelactone hydrolase
MKTRWLVAAGFVVGAGIAGWLLFAPPAGKPLPPVVVAAADTRTVPADAPELGRAGPHAVGYRVVTLVQPGRADLLGFNPLTGNIPVRDRTLPVHLWYPAAAPAGAEPMAYPVATPPTDGVDPASLPATVMVQGRAFAEAEPLRNRNFPLVVISHGFRNWPTIISTIAEHLAGHGYVVASIGHGDAETSLTVPIELAFGAVVVSRTPDQRFVIAELQRRAADPTDPLAGLYDPSRTALMGYSMGGFGALATMGAGYDPAGALAQNVPGGLLTPMTEGAAELVAGVPPQVRAMALIAPWGGGPALRSWTPSGLAAVTVPTLMVAGDLDDVSGYADGVRWLWENMTGADRHLLVFQGARHNLPTDPLPPELAAHFAYRERYEEPVWRKDRMLAVTNHMLTAFLDTHLKGEAAKARYLAVPTPIAADGAWPLEQGQQAGDRTAGPDDPASAGYWPGFQRRWAVGLELHHRPPGR